MSWCGWKGMPAVTIHSAHAIRIVTVRHQADVDVRMPAQIFLTRFA